MKGFFQTDPSDPETKTDIEEEEEEAEDQLLEVFQEVNKIFSRQTDGRLGVSTFQDGPIAQSLLSSSASPSNVFLTLLLSLTAGNFIRAIFC